MWEQARLAYLQTALNAFRDVSDALVSREKFDAARAEQIRAVRFAEEAVGLSLMRFREGLSSYIEVLEAQQRLYPAQLELAQTEVERRLAIVRLYKALGGGWNRTDLQWMSRRAHHEVSAGPATITCEGLLPEVLVPIQFDDTTVPPASRIMRSTSWTYAPSNSRTSEAAGLSSIGARQIRPASCLVCDSIVRTTFAAMPSLTYISTPQHRTTS